MEYLLLILTVLGVIIGILTTNTNSTGSDNRNTLSILLDNDCNEYKYKCHHCKKKFKESDIKDLRGPWHTKDWTCPHCKHQNVTLKSYDY